MNIIAQKLMHALEVIGKRNGHKVPASQDPAVSTLHEYYVCTEAEAYFKKRRNNAKKTLQAEVLKSETLSEKLDAAVKAVIKTENKETITLTETNPYLLCVDVKNGASFLDVPKLKVTLMRECKMKADSVEALIKKSTNRRAPSKSWKVIER